LSFHLPAFDDPSPESFDSSPPAVPVQLRLLDRNGDALINSDGNPILPPDSVWVRRGETITLELFGYDLASPSSRGVGVRAEVVIFNMKARGLVNLEVTDTVSGRRFVLYDRYERINLGLPGIFAEPVFTHCLGPLTLLSSETARLSVILKDPVNKKHGEVGVELYSQGPPKYTSLAKDVVILHESTPSGVLEYTAPHADLQAIGCVRFSDWSTALATLVTLEISDRDGNTVLILDWSIRDPWPGPTGGGGGGYALPPAERFRR